MSQPESTGKHVQIAETLLRFYVLLAQYLDRCENEAVRAAMSEADFGRHLDETRKKIEELVASNRIVPSKVHSEFEQVIDLGRQFTETPNAESVRLEFENERERLRIKSSVLSDLMAVYRSV